jgi:hypothetical protein
MLKLILIVGCLGFAYSWAISAGKRSRQEEKLGLDKEYEEMDEVAADKMCNGICYDCDAWDWCKKSYEKNKGMSE